MYSLYGFPESIPTREYKLNFTEKCLNYTYYTLNQSHVINQLSTFETTKNKFGCFKESEIDMSIVAWINRRVELWKENRCPDCGRKLIYSKCGSIHVKPSGWVDYNHRHYCSDCQEEEWL